MSNCSSNIKYTVNIDGDKNFLFFIDGEFGNKYNYKNEAGEIHSFPKALALYPLNDSFRHNSHTYEVTEKPLRTQ